MFDRQKVIDALMENGGIYGDLFSEEKTYTHIQLESGRIEKLERAEDKGNGLRIITPWKTFYASTNSFDQGRLTDMARQLARLARERNRLGKPHQTFAVADYPFSININSSEVDISRKLALVNSLEAKVKKMERRITQVRIVYRDTLQKTETWNSEGQTVRDERTQVILNVFLVGQENGEMQTSYEATGGFYGFEFFNEHVVEELAVKAAKRLSGLLSARGSAHGHEDSRTGI
ncbi:MAG TPA: DNA gyrase modulator [Syntrophorhabdaceae bacterium]|nr:DNA gyrase modulator [Syntrophorhabdaceae bacterium]